MWWSETTIDLSTAIGRFENGRGEFLGDDVEDEKPVRVRFDWTSGDSRAGSSGCKPTAGSSGN